MSRLIRLYPKAWRARYGEELLDLAAARPLGVTGTLDLLRGAADAHRHPELVDRSLDPASLDEAVTPQRYRDLVVARRLGFASIVGGALWLVAWAVASAGPVIHEQDGSTYRDGAAAAPFLMAAMILLSSGLAGQLIRLPSRLVVTRFAALVALVVAPLYGFGPWLLQFGAVLLLALIVMALGAWWAEAWSGRLAGGLVAAIVAGAGVMAASILGLAEYGPESPPFLVALAALALIWAFVGATLLRLPAVRPDLPEEPAPAIETLPA